MSPTPMLQEEWVWHPELRSEIYLQYAVFFCGIEGRAWCLDRRLRNIRLEDMCRATDRFVVQRILDINLNSLFDSLSPENSHLR